MRYFCGPAILSDPNQFPLDFTGSSGAARADEHVDFRPNPEVRQIDAWFHGEQGAWEDPAVIVGFEIVHVRARSVHFFADRMPGAMHEVLAEAFTLDMGAGGIVDFVAAKF